MLLAFEDHTFPPETGNKASSTPSSDASHQDPVHLPCSLEISALYQNLDVSCTKLTDGCLSFGLSAREDLEILPVQLFSLYLSPLRNMV